MSRRAPLLLAGAGVLVLASVLAGVTMGSEPVPFAEVMRVFGSRLGLSAPASDTADRIVWLLRLPRVLMALTVGGGLALVGVAMQALVRNPLAEPYVLGLSSGAAAGASLFYLGFLPPLLSQALTLPLAAFLGSLLVMVLVYLVARAEGYVSVTRLLLAGVAFSSLMGSVAALVTLASPDPNRVRTVLFWLLGSLNGTRWEGLPLPLAATLAGLLVLMGLGRTLDALLLGEEPAAHLGIPVEATKRVLILLSALLTGLLVATTGAIGFVGLIVPHAVRTVAGVVHRQVLPLSLLTGALFLLWADLVARTLLPSQDLPVGIVTALCGVPFFLLLIRQRRYQFGA
jgi:iron complex transport system permease protein